MKNFGTVVILAGLVIVILAQIVGAIMVFKASILKGILSLVIPGYFIVVLRREGMYGLIVGSWVFGVLCMAIGTVALS